MRLPNPLAAYQSMMDGPCLVCGASWECAHHADPERDRLLYVRPDGPTPRKNFQRSVAAIGAAREAILALAGSIRAAGDAIQGFTAAWDALPEATKEAVRRLD